MNEAYRIEADSKRRAHELNRRDMCERLGLEFHGVVADGFGTTVSRYHWPKQNARTRYDHIVFLIVYGDGSWTAALDDPWLKTSDTEAALRVMAKASETITPS